MKMFMALVMCQLKWIASLIRYSGLMSTSDEGGLPAYLLAERESTTQRSALQIIDCYQVNSSIQLVCYF